MADKSPKFLDIKAPEKSAPSSSSRPLLVTNRSVLGNDPMVNPNADDGAGTKPAVPLARTAKTIKPVSADFVAPESKPEESDPTAAPEPEGDTIAVTKKPAEPATETESKEDAPAAAEEPEPEEPAAKAEEPVSTPAPESEEPAPIVNRDAAASSQADEAKAAAEAEAAVAREEQLENLIDSGQYNVPIIAVHRKRSQMVAVLLCLLAIVLGLVVADVALDAGLFEFNGVPHTDFLKDK